MIKLQIIGNLGKDAVVNNVNGKTVINFSAAHTEKYKDSTGVQKDRTTWVECAYWTDRTAVAPYLKKGTTVYVEGIPDVRSYTTADGRTGATLALRVSNIQLLGGKSAEGSTNNYQANNSTPQTNYSNSSNATATLSNQAPQIDEVLDDLPF
jgi:single-strand DNA-binding protein